MEKKGEKRSRRTHGMLKGKTREGAYERERKKTERERRKKQNHVLEGKEGRREDGKRIEKRRRMCRERYRSVKEKATERVHEGEIEKGGRKATICKKTKRE